MNDEYDYLYKIVLIGDSGVGKSNLLSRWTIDEFNEESKSTIGVEFATKNVIYDEKRIKAQIWDTAGQERYRAITSAYYRGASGALIVYDITDKKSFDHINDWADQINFHRNDEIIIVIVGNKCDLETIRRVSIEDATKYATTENFLFIETSAKNNDNVDKAFNDLIINIYEKHKNNLPESEKDNTVLKSNEIIFEEISKSTKKTHTCCTK